MFPRFFSLLILLTGGLLALYAGDPSHDIIIGRDGKTRTVIIDSEETTETHFRFNGAGQPQRIKAGDIKSVSYGFERVDGFILAGRAELARGKYEAAAALFGSAAAGGAREPERVWGAWFEGDAFEAMGNFESAAAAFDKISTGVPKHRLAIDATYRKGFALALAGKTDLATAVAEALAKEANKEPRYRAREAAVRAALAAKAGDPVKARDFAGRANFNRNEEVESWTHFTLWRAEASLMLGDAAAARRFFDDLDRVVTDPGIKSRVALGRAKALLVVDPQLALVEFLRLDCLPLGSPDHKAIARVEAAKILIAAAAALRADPEAMKDEKKAAFAGEQESTARVLLKAVSNNSDITPDLPAKATATAMLETMAPAAPATAAPVK